MQSETEPSRKFYAVSNSEDDASRLLHQCRLHSDRNFLGTTTATCIKRRHTCQNARKKPLWFASRKSKIKLPTQFLLGGSINDPLNLQGLEKEHAGLSEVNTCGKHRRKMKMKHSHRIGFPYISDASDPLNLKNASSEEPQSVSNDYTSTAEKIKNASNRNHCQETIETDQVLHVLPFDENEDILKQECQSVVTSVDVTEKLCHYNSSFTLIDRNQHCVPVSECSKTDTVSVAGVCKVNSDIANAHVPSIFSEDKAVTCTYSNEVTSHEKIVSPVLSYSHNRARKRKRHNSCACKETYPSAGSLHKSCKKSKKKFPCGNYVAYYGYRNVNSVKDPRLQLLSKELFEGKNVLDIGCNAGIVTIAVACSYLPRQILGIDVDQRLISLAKRNVRRYMDEHSYPSCLETTFGPIATSLLPSADCSAFPHNVLFQVVKFLKIFIVNLILTCCVMRGLYSVMLYKMILQVSSI